MPSELKKIERRKKYLTLINELSNKEDLVLIIHYSCERFYDSQNGKSPRITSIAVRNFSSGQTASFSIHKVAELKSVPFSEIDKNYDILEKKMLKEFFKFLAKHEIYYWIHWNMRDDQYGFTALENRYRFLKGKPKKLDESRKFDLSRALVSIYGVEYIGHPRLIKLMQFNHITDMNLLEGSDEATAFENKEYVKLHQSTLRKVDVLADILGRIIDGSIKTNSTWRDRYGVHPKIIIEYIAKHWLFSLITGLVGIASVIYEVLLTRHILE